MRILSIFFDPSTSTVDRVDSSCRSLGNVSSTESSAESCPGVRQLQRVTLWTAPVPGLVQPSTPRHPRTGLHHQTGNNKGNSRKQWNKRSRNTSPNTVWVWDKRCTKATSKNDIARCVQVLHRLQFSDAPPVSSEILYELTDVLTLPVGPHNTCAAGCQRDLPIPNPWSDSCIFACFPAIGGNKIRACWAPHQNKL